MVFNTVIYVIILVDAIKVREDLGYNNYYTPSPTHPTISTCSSMYLCSCCVVACQHRIS